MSGTRAGGKNLRATMIERLGSEQAWREYMAGLGREGGKNSGTGGFAYSKRMGLTTHIEAGKLGGKISKRKKVEHGEGSAV